MMRRTVLLPARSDHENVALAELDAAFLGRDNQQIADPGRIRALSRW